MATSTESVDLSLMYSNSTNISDAVLNSSDSSGSCSHSVHDIEFNKNVRIGILYITVCLNIIGSILVVMWISCNRRNSPNYNHFSRVNAFILNLTVADILVIFLAVLPQLVWEYADRAWAVGPIMCRLVKLLQSFSITSSNYILVVIAVDRHQAIRAPLKESISRKRAYVWKMASAGWIMAVLVNCPIVGLFHTNEINGQVHCENVFRDKPRWHRQLWLTYITCAVFVIPVILLAILYIRIVMKISSKATQNSVKRKDSFQPGKIHLQSTHSSSLPRAKMKTLKMTFVIIIMFIICSFPYCIVEMIMSYGDHCMISRDLAAILGGMAAFNSAANPYIYLVFNVKLSLIKDRSQSYRNTPKGYIGYHTANSQVNSKYSVHNNQAYPQLLRQDTQETNIEMKVMQPGSQTN